MPTDSFKKVIKLANSNKKFPVLSLIRDDPVMAATLSKMIMSQETPRYGKDGNREILEPNTYNFRTTSERLVQNSRDAKTVLQTLPEMELGAQILIASILSPKDMVTTEVNYSVAEGLLSPDVSSALIARTKKYFEQDYKIKSLLPKMLRDMLFETGSYPVAVIPENSIDEVINGPGKITLESLHDSIASDGTVKPLGLLGPVAKSQPKESQEVPGLSMESFSEYRKTETIDPRINLSAVFNKPVETFITVTDNHTLLKIPQINQRIREQRITGMIGSKAMESLDVKLTDKEISRSLYKERNFNFKPISTLKTQEQLNRHTVGNPLILRIPTEATIPVYVPGCPEKQIGFFILIDGDGNPISRATNTDYYQELSNRLNNNGSFPSAMLNKIKSQMTGFNPNNNDHINYSAKVYGDMIEQDLLARLRNGVYGNGVALAKSEEIYRVMLARTLAKQHTQMLFIPIELFTYFAFSYSDEGLGESILENMKILNSLRSMLMFANVMAGLKNSIGRTEVKIKLDEDDPNPQKTIEIAMHEIIRSRMNAFPLGRNSPADLTDYLQRAAFEFTYEGHPGLPDVAIDFGEKNSSYTKPDTELEENLRKKSIMAIGLSPETVDASFQAEFATSIVSNNVLLSKRVVQIQEQFTPQLSDHLRKCIMHSENLLNDLRVIITDNFDKLYEGLDVVDPKIKGVKDGSAVKEEKENDTLSEREKQIVINKVLNKFIANFEVNLPLPNSVTLDNQVAALETYTKALDVSLEAWISDKFFNTDVGGEVANQVNTIKEVLKAYFIRKWMAENAMMPELSCLTTIKHDGMPEVDIYQIQQDHITNLTKSLTEFMVGIQSEKKKSNDTIEKIGGVEEESTPSSSEESSSGESAEGNEEPSFEEPPSMDEEGEASEENETKEEEPEPNLNDETEEKDEKKEE